MTELAAENEELRAKLEEAKSDLAEQTEVTVALSEQRDALQVDLRRAQFLAQLSVCHATFSISVAFTPDHELFFFCLAED